MQRVVREQEKQKKASIERQAQRERDNPIQSKIEGSNLIDLHSGVSHKPILITGAHSFGNFITCAQT